MSQSLVALPRKKLGRGGGCGETHPVYFHAVYLKDSTMEYGCSHHRIIWMAHSSNTQLRALFGLLSDKMNMLTGGIFKKNPRNVESITSMFIKMCVYSINHLPSPQCVLIHFWCARVCIHYKPLTIITVHTNTFLVFMCSMNHLQCSQCILIHFWCMCVRYSMNRLPSSQCVLIHFWYALVL